MQKNAISYHEYVEYAYMGKKHAHDQQKKQQKRQNMQKKCNIVCV